MVAIALATSGGAAVPAAGVNCQGTDGKFSGRGATFQKRAMDAFIAGYTADVCGNVSDTFSGNDMVSYNVYDGVTAPVLTGSGFGRKAMICRTDAFGGTDGPYNNAQLAALNGDPHAQANLDVIFGGTPGSRNGQTAVTTGFE